MFFILTRHFDATFSLLNEYLNNAVKMKNGGAMQDRTADLLRARQALSQLSYSPIVIQWHGLFETYIPKSYF